MALVALGAEAREVLIGPFLAEELSGRLGRETTLHVIEILESINQGASFTPRLLGFATREDRAFFELLTKVKGLGPRRAQRALAAPTGEIARMIGAGDAKGLTRLPEIGKKLAETIIAEIGDKAGAFAGAEAGGMNARANGAALVVESRGPWSPAAEQAVAALVRLGEARAEAERMVDRVVRSADKPATPDAILAAALAVRGI